MSSTTRKRKHEDDDSEEQQFAAAPTILHEEEKTTTASAASVLSDEEDIPLRSVDSQQPTPKRRKPLLPSASPVTLGDTFVPLSPPVSSAEYALARQAFDRSLFTDDLLRSISPSSGKPLLSRVALYVNAMEEDSTRDIPRIDINHQRTDTGNTLIMTLTNLFGELCHPIPPAMKNDLNAIDGPVNDCIAKKHLLKLMDHMDVSMKNHRGQTALQFLANHIIINAQVYFDWYVLEKLLALGASVEEKWDGKSILMRAAEAGGTPFFPQRLLKHGADLTTKSDLGRNILHAMADSGNDRMMKALLFENHILLLRTGWSFEPDSAGETALALATRRSRSSIICAMLNTAHSQWKKQIQPLLLAELRPYLMTDLARIVCEYIDGSGLPWTKVGETKDDDSKEEHKQSEIQSNMDDNQNAQEAAMEVEEGDEAIDDMDSSDSEDDEDDIN